MLVQLIAFTLYLPANNIFFSCIIKGGSSKRLPNFTCTGKLFCSLPMESNGKTCNILNLKLIITSPFIQLMKNAGILIAGSDDIETYSLEGIPIN